MVPGCQKLILALVGLLHRRSQGWACCLGLLGRLGPLAGSHEHMLRRGGGAMTVLQSAGLCAASI